MTETLDGIVDRRIRMCLGNQSDRRNGIPVKEVNFQTNESNDVNLPNTNKVDVNVRSDSKELKGVRLKKESRSYAKVNLNSRLSL